jgi:hypothetical protein
MLVPYLALWALYALLVWFFPNAANLTNIVYLLALGAVWSLYLRLREQIQIVWVKGEKKPTKAHWRNKKSKSDDDIPEDPTWDQIRASLERAAHVGTTPLRSNNGHSGPAQMTLWGTTEPVRSEQIVRTVPEEPEWFRDQFKR